MAREPVPLDVSNTPEVLRLAQEVQVSGRPRMLRQGRENLAVLMPVYTPRRRSRPHSFSDATAVVARTAGVLKHYAVQPPPTAEEERAAIEQAIAEDVAQR
jgi:hypothetical protein